MPEILDKMRVPIGSLIVDAGLVLTLAFTAGSLTSRLETLDRRVLSMETTTLSARMPERIATLEQQAAQNERDRTEVLEALHRIESKLDGKVDKVR